MSRPSYEDLPKRSPITPVSSILLTISVTVVALGPLLVNGGFALRGDMVFTPNQPWKPEWLGLGGGVPRAVPMDALVSAANYLVPGAAVQRLLLGAAFLLAGFGIVGLLRKFGALAQAAAVLVYLWNPWVFERLAIGQWPMVLGYGLLPWLVLAAIRLRDGRPGGVPSVLIGLVLCGVCAPSMGLLGVLVALVVVLGVQRGQKRRSAFTVLGIGLLANLPWVLPAGFAEGLSGDQAQFGDFAARGESALGALASLISMGGIWKTSIVPAERTHVIVLAVASLLALACVGAIRKAHVQLGRPTISSLVAVGCIAMLIALLPTIGPIGDGLGDLSTHWPALGILRDSQRYLAPFGLLLAVGAAALVETLVNSANARRSGAGGLAVLVVLAPVVLLPSFAWGLAGGLQPVEYPADWARVSSAISSATGPTGSTVVLPWSGNYRGFAWNDNHALLDPADRYLPGTVLSDDRLFLSNGVLDSEDPFLARVGTALEASDAAAALRRLGVRWVLTEKTSGVSQTTAPAGESRYDGRWLRLIDLGAPATSPIAPRPEAPGWLVLVADAVVVLGTCISIWCLSTKTRRI